MRLRLGIACGNRTRVAGVRTRFPGHLEERDARVEDRAPGGNRTHVPRFAGACLATWRPVRGSGARTRTSIAGSKDQRPAVGRHLSSSSEPSLGVEPSPLAYQASVPRRGHRDGDREDRLQIVERTGIEPAAAALQVQLAPLAHASPRAVPTRIELAYRGRQPRILTRGFRDQMGAPRTRPGVGCAEGIEPSPRDSRTRVRPSHCAHHTEGFHGGFEPPSFARQATAPPAVRMERGSKPGDRTLHVRRMKPTSPPGELLAAPAGRRGVEPRWSELETNPIPDRSLYVRDSGRTRTAILRFGISDPSPLEDGVLRAGVVYGSRTRVTGSRIQFPGPAGRTRPGARGWDRTSDLRHVTPAFIR